MPKTVGAADINCGVSIAISPTEEEELFMKMIVFPLPSSEEGFLIEIFRKINKEEMKMAKVELKKPVVEEISEQIKDAQTVVLVDYRGLTVAQDTALRKELRTAGISYKVYKNTMMNFAFKGTDFESLLPHLEGPNAIAISKDDATAPARILAKFAKTAPALEVRGGVVEGIYYDASGMEDIAKIPSREELLSKLLGSMQSPITNFARVMNQLAEKGGASGEAPAAE